MKAESMYQIPGWINEKNLLLVREDIDAVTLSDTFERLIAQIFDDRKFMRYVFFEILEGWGHFLGSYDKSRVEIQQGLMDLYREILEKDVSEEIAQVFFQGFPTARVRVPLRLTTLKSVASVTNFFAQSYRVDNHDSFFQCWCLLHLAETMKLYTSCGERFFPLWIDGTLPYERVTDPQNPWVAERKATFSNIEPLAVRTNESGLVEVFNGTKWAVIGSNQ